MAGLSVEEVHPSIKVIRRCEVEAHDQLQPCHLVPARRLGNLPANVKLLPRGMTPSGFGWRPLCNHRASYRTAFVRRARANDMAESGGGSLD